MTLKIDGIVPVMLTPFNDVGQVDYEGLANLTEWYLNNGADALFAVCQSGAGAGDLDPDHHRRTRTLGCVR